MNFHFLRAGMAIFLSSAMAFGAMAQQEKTSSKTAPQQNDKDRVIVMSKKELAETISRIVEETLQEEEVVENRNSIDNLIQTGKDRDILTLLLQYRNLQSMFSRVMGSQDPCLHQGSCIHTQPQTNNVPQAIRSESSPRDLETLAQLRDLEQEVIQLRSELSRRERVANNPTQDNSDIINSLNDLNRDLQARLQALEDKTSKTNQAPQVDEDLLRRREEALASRNFARSDVQLMRSVYFQVNSDKLSSEGVSAIKNVANFVANNPRALVLVYGYASIDGPVQYNNELSDRRASSVEKALKEAGVPEVAIVKYGSGVDSVPTEKENARRVDMQVIF